MTDNVLVIFQKGTDAQIFYFSFPKMLLFLFFFFPKTAFATVRQIQLIYNTKELTVKPSLISKRKSHRLSAVNTAFVKNYVKSCT